MTLAPLNFDTIHTGAISIQALADTLTREDLRQATALSVNTMLSHIADCTDVDMAFVPHDPAATEGATNAAGEIVAGR